MSFPVYELLEKFAKTLEIIIFADKQNKCALSRLMDFPYLQARYQVYPLEHYL